MKLTLAELGSYDGSKPEKPLLVSVLGKIFDVVRRCRLTSG